MDKPARAPAFAEVPSFSDGRGGIDLRAVQSGVRRLVDAGWAHITVAGLAGEYENLTLSDQRALIECAAEAAGGRATVAAGAFDAGTDKAAERIAEHAEAGAHAHLCVASHYFSNAHPDELLRHFSALKRAAGGDALIVVDSPAHVGFCLPDAVLAELRRMEGVLLYEHVLDPLRLAFAGEALCREELALLNGAGAGFISRLAVLFPCRLRRPEALSAASRDALLAILRAGSHPAAAPKWAAASLRLCACGELLPPSSGLLPEEKRLVEEALDKLRAEEERCAHE